MTRSFVSWCLRGICNVAFNYPRKYDNHSCIGLILDPKKNLIHIIDAIAISLY